MKKLLTILAVLMLIIAGFYVYFKYFSNINNTDETECDDLILSNCFLNTIKNTHEGKQYEGYTTEAEAFIDIPKLRQYGNYTCGTTCVQMLMNWLFPYDCDINLIEYEEELGTTENEGTSPEKILCYLKKNGVVSRDKQNRNVDDLITSLNKGHPMLMCIQAWSSMEDESYNTNDPSNLDTYLIDGHWVICVGYQNMVNGYRFFFNDPACVGYCFLGENELNTRWIDMDNFGTIYYHYGIEIIGKSFYNVFGAYHLD